jgi:RNA:NAD 2'-phosphotransferase (TPT1/KptA family)
VSENVLGTTLNHGTLLANLEDIISQGLIPGGRRTSRKHVHVAEDASRIREGSEIIIEVKTSALFLITQNIYKSQAGVILTPDVVPSSTFIRAYYNRPGGSEVWNNPRANRSQQPSSSSSGANAPATRGSYPFFG